MIHSGGKGKSGGGKRKTSARTALVASGSVSSDGSVKLTRREYIDATLNDASFSPLAALISNVVLVTILVSTVSFVVGTEPAYADSAWLDGLEVVVVGIFSVEYLSRFVVTFEDRCSFVLAPLNLVDLVAILPWYIEKIAGAGGAGEVLRVLRVLRVVRVFRVFKLAKYTESLGMFTACMVHSLEALKLLCFFFSMAVLIFSSLMYYAEQGTPTEVDGETLLLRSDGNESPFTSISTTFWWSIVTMTTVGYGDTYPVEQVGKGIATCAMLGGVLVLALPLSVVGQNFTDAYHETMKSRAYAELQTAVPEGADPEVFVHAAELLEEHCAQIDKICGAISFAMQREGDSGNVYAAMMCKQFELQAANIKQACDGLANTVTDPAILSVILAEPGAPANIATAKTMLEKVTVAHHIEKVTVVQVTKMI